jgi:hypothetical protein
VGRWSVSHGQGAVDSAIDWRTGLLEGGATSSCSGVLHGGSVNGTAKVEHRATIQDPTADGSEGRGAHPDHADCAVEGHSRNRRKDKRDNTTCD